MGGNIFQRAISMETYRGCPYNCTYCNSPTTRNLAKDFQIGNFMRRKSADVIEKELLHYIDLYDPDLIMFQDDSFLARPAKEIFEFCEMWSKYKIPFWFNTRIENCKPEYLEALKEAGVYRMTFGVESGNEEYRSKVLKRNANNYTYHKFLDYINDSNIPYSLNVILGMPFETREMVMDTAEFIHKARGYDGLTISMWQPYWGTDLRKQAEKAGFLDPKYICGWESKSGQNSCQPDIERRKPRQAPNEAPRIIGRHITVQRDISAPRFCRSGDFKPAKRQRGKNSRRRDPNKQAPKPANLRAPKVHGSRKPTRLKKWRTRCGKS